MERTLSRVHVSHSQLVRVVLPRWLTCIDQVGGSSSTVVPQTTHVV